MQAVIFWQVLYNFACQDRTERRKLVRIIGDVNKNWEALHEMCETEPQR